MADSDNEVLDPQQLYSKEYCIGAFVLFLYGEFELDLTFPQEEAALEKSTRGKSATTA